MEISPFKNIRKKHVNWQSLLSSTPSRDYVFQKEPYEEQIRRAVDQIRDAEGVIIGAGAGLSAAAGLTYSGKRWTDNFREFIEKYGAENMPDMYSAGFYPFATQEAMWGYWSKHAWMNRFEPPALTLYQELREMVSDKEYFVLTTNVDGQFQKAGFDGSRIFATQGDYGKIQCKGGCHPKTYDAKELFREMNAVRKDCVIPSALVPRCPVCGGPMAMHLRCDNYFVEDESWHEAADRYAEFLDRMKGKKVALLELGVGFNTPIIIRFPFEKLMRENEEYSLIRLNMNEAVVPESFGTRATGIGGDMAVAVKEIHAGVQNRRREYLIRYLLKEDVRFYGQKVPEVKEEQEVMLRSLMNLRPPKKVPAEFLRTQDAYLKERNRERGITRLTDLKPVSADSRLYVWQGDITTLECDAIVNACNSQMLGCFTPMHACIDNFIHTYAGVQLRYKMGEIMKAQGHEEKTGQAKITPGYNLPAKYVLHTVGPIIQWKVTEEDERLLASCYRKCLELASKQGAKSIAFCCISTGVFRFPKQRAAEIAVETVKQFLSHQNEAETQEIQQVIFNVFKDEDLEIYERLLQEPVTGEA